MKTRLVCTLSIVLLSSVPTRELAAQATDARPNIIVFLVDDMGWQDTSLPFHTERTERNRRYHTPNMERLAKRGVKFTQAYAYAVCSPSRVSLLTGQSASRHRVTNWTLRKDKEPDRQNLAVLPGPWNVNGLSPDPSVARSVTAPTLPGLLRELGYKTIHCGKAHFGAKETPGEDPKKLGFDVNIAGHAAGGPGSYHGDRNFSAVWRRGSPIWDVPGLAKYHGKKINLTEALTREAIAALETTLAAKRPFFLYMSHYTVHAPWEADRRFIEKYRAKGYKGIEAKFASMLESMDRSLGDLLDFVEAKGIADDTVVLFLSDNGSPSQTPRNKPLRGHKLTPYEGGFRVPMIAHWPGVTKAASTCTAPVHIDDVFPTICAIAGLPQAKLPRIVDGDSLVPLLRGQSSLRTSTPTRDANDKAQADHEARSLFWHYPNTYNQPPYTAMRRGRYKLIYHHIGRRFELFDLVADLSETTNLATKHPAILRDLAARMTAHLIDTDAVMTIDSKTKHPVALPLATLNQRSK